MIIDLRSDTVTKPSNQMLEAMMKANVGDDVFGDDPTVNLLQNRTAEFFGAEAGLFFPSGTMANQVAIKTHTNPGDEVICDFTSHVYRYEGGGIAANSGASVRLLNGQRGIFNQKEIIENVNSDDIHFPVTKLVVVENTVNKGGGACWQHNQLEAVSETSRKLNLKIHLDGARLWNAIIASKIKPENFGNWFDSISVCYSKGMGCPVGSVLLGNADFISKAKRVRKRMGGGMRQAGYLAAACLYALENNFLRLEQDHKHAKTIEDTLKNLNCVLEVMPVETNIILFKLQTPEKADNLVKKLKEKNILALTTGGGWIRFVLHIDITEKMVFVLVNELLNFNQI